LANFFDGLVGQLPGLALNTRDEFSPNPAKGLDSVDIGESDAGWQQRIDVFGQASRQLLEHSPFGFSSGDGIAFQRKVVVEALDKLSRVQIELLESLVQDRTGRGSFAAAAMRRSFVPKSSSGSKEAISVLS
jgi:hypothetical protein